MKNISTAQTSAEAPKYWTISYLHNANLILHSKAYSICNTSMWPAFNLTLLHQRKLFCPHLVKDTPPAWSAILSKISPTWAIIGSTVAETISPWTFYPKHIWTPLHHPLPCTPPSMTMYIVNTSQCEVPVFFETEQNLWPIEEGPSLTTFCSPPLNCASEKINLIGKLSTFSTKP